VEIKKEEPEHTPYIEVVTQSPVVVKEATPNKPVVLTVDTRHETPKEEKREAKVSNEVKLTQTSVPAGRPTIAKVNESGSALSPSLQKTIGMGRMSGVKTLSVTLGAAPAAIEKCNEAAHGTTIRWVALKIEREQLELVASGNSSGNAPSDMDTMKANAKDGEAMYFFFRIKDSGDAQWALVSWVPDATPVKQRMLYASSVDSTKVLMGADRVDKLLTFNSQSQFKWDEFVTAPIKLKNERDFLAVENDASLPFSELELAKRQVDREERQARQEMGTKATAASGFHTVAFPVDAKAEEAIRGLAAGQHSWVHLSLDPSFKSIELKSTASPSGVSALAELLHKTEPQFYVYNYKDNVPVLIYMCPEKGPTVKNKMVYSTCKSSLAEAILSFGLSDVKKLDIRAPDELTVSELDDAYVAKAAFKPSDSGDSGHSAGRSSKGAGPGRFGGVSALGGLPGLGAAVANKAALKKVNQ
jgi:twinfilin-like protein